MTKHPFLRAFWLLVPLLCLAGLPQPASAQPIGNPYNTVVVSSPSPYWGYSANPYAGYLFGVAEVTRAQGQWLKDQQEAILMREKNRQEKLISRQKEVEYIVWEREFRAEAAKRERARIFEEEKERNRTMPSLTEILSASALNFLLHQLKQKPDLDVANSRPVEPEWLELVHTTYVPTGTGGNIGLLKGRNIPWPLLLRRKEYKDERDAIKKLLDQAKQEVLRDGGAAAETLDELRDRLNGLSQRIDQQARADRPDACSPSDYIRARRSLSDLQAAVQMLEQPEAKYYLNALEGKTVAELVSYMKKNGLSFAPATAGCERAYIALHRALADEYNRVEK
jgi:hypothetical protein